jgi:tellurite resistance protein
MEAVLLFIGFIILRVIWSTIFSGGGESYGIQNSGMDKLEIRVEETSKLVDEITFDVFEVKAKGLIPVPRNNTSVEIVTHLFDTSGGKSLPVLSSVEWCQEQTSTAFESRQTGLQVPVDSGWGDWTPIATILKDSLNLPYKGRRIIEFQTSIISADTPPNFHLGFDTGDGGTYYAVASNKMSYSFEQLGYMDLIENQSEIEELTIQLAMGVAATDGSLDPEEGEEVKKWVMKKLANVSESKLEDEKKRLNEASRNAHQNALAGKINTEAITGRFNEIGSQQTKYEALELCLDVLRADGTVDPSELEYLDALTKSLGLDPEKYRGLRDRSISDLGDLNVEHEGDLEKAIGVSPEMDTDEIRSHLTKEYARWNGRISSDDEQTKVHAEKMLMYIAELRVKYLSK